MVESLKNIRKRTYDIETTKHPCVMLIKLEKNLMIFRQTQNMYNETYYEIFISNVDVFETCGGNIAQHNTLINTELLVLGITPPGSISEQL